MPMPNGALVVIRVFDRGFAGQRRPVQPVEQPGQRHSGGTHRDALRLSPMKSDVPFARNCLSEVSSVQDLFGFLLPVHRITA
jgi:hypothetical protein